MTSVKTTQIDESKFLSSFFRSCAKTHYRQWGCAKSFIECHFDYHTLLKSNLPVATALVCLIKLKNIVFIQCNKCNKYVLQQKQEQEQKNLSHFAKFEQVSQH